MKIGRTAIFAGMVISLFALFPFTAHAYVGPGSALTFFGSLIGLVVALFMAFAAVLYWPVRMLMKKLKKKRSAEPID